jgi:hypothetical protein
MIQPSDVFVNDEEGRAVTRREVSDGKILTLGLKSS